VLFNSYVFILCFLPLTLIGFRLLLRYHQGRLAIGLLVSASLLYYGWWNPVYLPLILFSILANFLLGLRLSSEQEQGKTLVLTIGVIINLGLLGFFKYTNFAIDSISVVFGTAFEDFPRIVLPLAISFFTFQQIAYLVDSRRGLTREYRFLDYCLFVTFFPQLIAGPIVHHGEMLPQFIHHSDRPDGHADLPVGFTIFTIGLFKKVILADQVALFANPVFDSAFEGLWPTTNAAWVGTLAYTLELYLDFSGYSDMAIGLGRMFGIRLPVNFHSPYKAVNIIDFWRRWHITLSRFLREYLYFPLGGNRKGSSRRYVNIMITMLLGGLWHGAGWTFVAWGVLHGVYLMINHAFHSLREKLGWHEAYNNRFTHIIALGLTFLGVMIGWVLFRAESFESAGMILRAMGGLQDGAANLSGFDLDFGDAWAWIIILLGVVFFAPATHELMSRHNLPTGWRPRLDENGQYIHTFGWNPDLLGAILTAGAFIYTIHQLVRPTEFLYFQF